MKNWLVFILILVSKSLFACGYYYPFGEDLRFCFFKPENFNFDGYTTFHYSSNSFNPFETYSDDYVHPNNQLWFEYCSKKVSILEIENAIDVIPNSEINVNSKNKMIHYLFDIKDFDAINYLKFAKSCETFNSYYNDPWERSEYMVVPKRTALINQAVLMSKKVKNEYLKLRYTFLGIRMAFYNQDKIQVKKMYDAVFKDLKTKNVLYYWSLSFVLFSEIDKPLANFYTAQVFGNSPDKRWAVHSYFDRLIPLNSVLKFAKTSKEKANVYLMHAIKTDRSLEDIRGVYNNDPKSEGLNFLMLREINKIEDWVHTPYYTLNSPSIDFNYDWKDKDGKSILGRVENDRKYAEKVLNFINTIDLKKNENPILWKASKVQLLFITKKYDLCLNTINQIERNLNKLDAVFKELQLIKALCLTANQKNGNAIILDLVKPIIIENSSNSQFIFAVGRELEYKQNTSDAALLYSKITESGSVYWKPFKNKFLTFENVYSDYFEYINVYYTPKQIENLIIAIEKNKNSKNEFLKWKYEILAKEKPRMYDLLGTKYIRQNKLEMALANFKKGDDENKMSNPFYDLEYIPSFVQKKDSITLTKSGITAQLITYLNKANNVKEKNRDYYYFLAANCYYNMSQYGNTSGMRRYNWTSEFNIVTNLEDNEEYNQCNLAKKYYLLSKKNAKTDKFKALCLRMASRCEKNKIIYEMVISNAEAPEDYDKYLHDKNKYYKKLESQFPDAFYELSNCENFNDYFKSRR
jgi:hypothetical protein